MYAIIANLILAITGSVAMRVMAAIGLGTVSYIGLTSLAGTVVDLVISNYSGLPPVVLAFMNLAGAGAALGIITSAIITRVSMLALKRFVPL